MERRSFIGLAALGAAWLAAGKRTAWAAEPGVSFVQITDTHLPDKPGLEPTRKVIEAINELTLPCQFVVHTGDVSNDGWKDEKNLSAARDEMAKLKKKVYYVPGNNDVSFDKPERYTPVFEKYFGPANSRFEPVPGTRFVLFNSQPLSDEAKKEVREAAFAELGRLLDPAGPTVLFCHAAGLPDFYKNEMHPGWSEKTMTRWTGAMKDGGVFAVISGHFHRDELHHLDNIPVFVSPPVSTYLGRQSSFRWWNLKGKELSYRTIYI